MAYSNIGFELQEGIGTITFSRPKALNALNRELLQEFDHALADIARNDQVSVLVLTGEGEKSFVAGADINELASLDPLKAKTFVLWGLTVINRISELPIPVIAAVNGFALGGGLEIAMACDFIYASENASFGQPEIKLGLIPGYGGTQRLPRLIGINQAKELLYTGNLISAAQAHQLGIVNRVTPPEELMPAVMKTAREMASKGRVAIRATKQAVNHGMSVDLATGLRIETDAFALCFTSKDAKEGTTAFLEKRAPVFTGTFTE
ncbi:MAG: enoyl-CoA hydratase/isomerase family protein [Desulfatitalea sp.]|nr:enoyl-CoA hydratase/isomerase family protein [Desulfatitalea sp.]NNK01971.1 enoyl-CoA hydratase/isomerase family protein [Desulfatitalea sp.]